MAWIGVLYQGIGSTWIGFLIYYFLITRIGASRMMLAWMLFPIFGVFEGAIFLREWDGTNLFFKLSEVVGALLVISGLGLVVADKERFELIRKRSKRAIDDSTSKEFAVSMVPNKQAVKHVENPLLQPLLLKMDASVN